MSEYKQADRKMCCTMMDGRCTVKDQAFRCRAAECCSISAMYTCMIIDRDIDTCSVASPQPWVSHMLNASHPSYQVSLIENPNFDFTITYGSGDHELKLFPAMKVSCLCRTSYHVGRLCPSHWRLNERLGW